MEHKRDGWLFKTEAGIVLRDWLIEHEVRIHDCEQVYRYGKKHPQTPVAALLIEHQRPEREPFERLLSDLLILCLGRNRLEWLVALNRGRYANIRVTWPLSQRQNRWRAEWEATHRRPAMPAAVWSGADDAFSAEEFRRLSPTFDLRNWGFRPCPVCFRRVRDHKGGVECGSSSTHS